MAGSLVPKWVKKEIVDVWVGEDLWLMLLSASHDSNAIHRYVSEVVANEITDIGLVYPAGGVHIPPGTATAQPSGNNYYLDLPDIDIGPGATITYRYGILYTRTGGSGQATYKIRAQIDFLTPQTVTNGTSTIQWNALGVILVS